MAKEKKLNLVFIKISAFTILASTGWVRRSVIKSTIRRVRHVGRGSFSLFGSVSLFASDSLFCSAFVTATPIPRNLSSSFSTSTIETATDMDASNNNEDGICQVDRYSYKGTHSQDQSLWMYHIESTTSTMDEAKHLVEQKFTDAEANEDCTRSVSEPKSFLISATSQSNGRGTSKRNWKSSQTGNALFTIGIQQSAWMNELKSRNDGRMVPLTLLPLKVGSVVAFRIQKFLEQCGSTQESLPRVTVKWPNDVLLYNQADGQSGKSYEKVAGILIESSQDWFLIGIGINVGYAPDIPSAGIDYGRKATALSQYCTSSPSNDNIGNEEFWVEASKRLARDVAHDIHSWLYPLSSSSLPTSQMGVSILNEWKSYVDWDMELTLRDTPKREKVILKQVLDDGRVVVQEIETGLTRTLVSDYFL
jgi:biotin-(acetyl-CoA carboxylase) ligase